MKYRVQGHLIFDTDTTANDVLAAIENHTATTHAWAKEKQITKNKDFNSELPMIIVDLAFDTDDYRTQIIDYLKTIKGTLQPGSKVYIHICNHDETNVVPCVREEISL